MKEQIYRLCKRMKKCTLDNLVQMLETDKAIIETALLYLEQENKVQVRDGVIFTDLVNQKKKVTETKRFNLMIQYETQENVELIIKGFCLKIPPNILCFLVNVGDACICNYYTIFRRLIYERQFQILLTKFFEKPQQGRYRLFFNKRAFFYMYDNMLFVSEKFLRASTEENFKKAEIKEFKKIYSYLSRIESNNSNENYLYYRLAESLWRRNKNFDELYFDLKNNLVS